MPQRTIELLPALRRELPWFALMVVALLASFALAHVVIGRGILLPSLASGGGAPPWVWAALYAPELIALLMVGWRLRSWALVALYAGAAAVLREGFHLGLRLAGEVGPHSRFASPVTEITIALPITMAAYVLVFALASASGREGTAQDESRSRPAP